MKRPHKFVRLNTQRMRELLAEPGKSIESVAARAGVSAGTVFRILKGERTRIPTARAVAWGLHVKLASIIAAPEEGGEVERTAATSAA